MTIRNLENLPLLVSFRAIAEEGSIVAAATRLGVTQSAVSKHLARLRAWLGDPLFVRTSDGMQPTPRAIAIKDQVDAILGGAEGLTQTEAPDPGSFTGTFTLSTTDEVLSTLLPTLVTRMGEAAPDLRLKTMPLQTDYSLHGLETGAVNLLIAVNWHAPEALRQSRLFEDRFVVAMRADNPLAPGDLTLENFAAARHILVAPLGHSQGAIDKPLSDLGLSRQIVASVPAFGLITPDLLGKSGVVTLPARVAQRLAFSDGLILKEPPLTTPSIVYHALWHPRFDREPRLRWMLSLISAALKAG